MTDQVPAPQPPERLTDRECAQDILFAEKSLSLAYFMAERESANQSLRAVLHHLHQDVEALHARVFHAMHQRGWYQTPVAGQQAIEAEIIRWEQRQVRQPELN